MTVFQSAELERLAEETADAAALERICEYFRVTDVDSYEEAQAALLDVGPRIKSAEAKQKAAKDAAKLLLSPFERPLNSYRKLKDFLKAQILGYEQAERSKAEAAEQEAIALLEAAQGDAQDSPEVLEAQDRAHALVVASAATPERIKGIARTYTYRAEIVDPAKVPKEYWVIDLQALNQVARESKGAAQVPGVEFHTIEGLRA